MKLLSSSVLIFQFHPLTFVDDTYHVTRLNTRIKNKNTGVKKKVGFIRRAARGTVHWFLWGFTPISMSPFQTYFSDQTLKVIANPIQIGNPRDNHEAKTRPAERCRYGHHTRLITKNKLSDCIIKKNIRFIIKNKLSDSSSKKNYQTHHQKKLSDSSSKNNYQTHHQK